MNDIERILREDARRPLDDDGFTLRVMQALPAASLRDRPWVGPALVMGSAVLGSVLAAALSPAGHTLLAGFTELMHLRLGSQAAIASLALCGALLLSALVLATDSE